MVKLSLCAEWNETKHNKNQTEKNAHNKMPLHPFPDPDWSLIPYEHIMLPTACIQYLNMMLKLCIIAYVFISFARVLFGRPCVYARECVGFLLSIFLSVFSTSLRFFRQSVVCAHIVFFFALRSWLFLWLLCRVSLLITINRCERYGSIELK